MSSKQRDALVAVKELLDGGIMFQNAIRKVHKQLKNPAQLDLQEWQDFLYRFKNEADKIKDSTLPIAMRIENTQLTIARHFGGIKYNGSPYTYFEPKIPDHEPNPDGTPYVAWLLVRHDFLMWVSKELKKESKSAKAESNVEQPSLL